jgi:two-component system sensor histidine kinase KdpD
MDRARISVSDTASVTKPTTARFRLGEETRTAKAFQDYLAVGAMVLGITLPALFLRPFVGPRSIVLIYLLGVVVLALFVGRGPTLLAAAVSAVAWRVFFLAPIARVRISDSEDAIMLGIYFVVALLSGLLTTRIRAREKAAHQRDKRSWALYQMAHDLLGATTLDQMIEAIVRHMESVFQAPVAVLLADSAGKLSYQGHPASTYDIAGPEQPIAEWVFDHAQPAGRFTLNQAQCDTLFVPLLADSRSLGVIGLRWQESSEPSREQTDLLDEWAKDIATALDRNRWREQYDQAEPQLRH